MSNKGPPNHLIQGVAGMKTLMESCTIRPGSSAVTLRSDSIVRLAVLRPSFVRWPQEVVFVPDLRFREVVSEGLKFIGDGDFGVIAKWSDE